MYNIVIENGRIDWNQNEIIYQSGYHHQADITNGNITDLQYIPNKKEVKRIIQLVKNDAISITVYKLVKMPLDKICERLMNKNFRRMRDSYENDYKAYYTKIPV